ncbi:MAG TPA: MFS transporter, partial [Pseudomonadales bacterium]|nr:MFS transporter [Pseudomonadales bacterium]
MATIRQGLQLLQSPDFARLFAAYVITFTGNAMSPIAIAFGVLALTGSTRDSSVVIAAPTLAAILVMLFAGVFADRAGRKRQMILAESLAAVSMSAIAVLFLTHHATVPVLAGLMMLAGTAAAMNSTASTGIIPLVVEATELQSANALLGAARSGSTTLGAALAGVLVATLGAGITIAVDAATFVVSAMLIASIKAKPQAPMEAASIFADLRLGWREFISHQWLWTIVLQFSVLVAAGDAVFGLLGPAVAKTQMNGAVDWGLIS